MKDLTTYINESAFKYDKASYSEEKFIKWAVDSRQIKKFTDGMSLADWSKSIEALALMSGVPEDIAQATAEYAWDVYGGKPTGK